MDILKSKWPAFLRALNEQGLKRRTIACYEHEYKVMLADLENHVHESLNEYLDQYVVDKPSAMSTLNRYTKALKIVRFVLCDETPNIKKRTSVNDLPIEYQRLIQECVSRDRAKGNSPKSQKNYEDGLKSFFLHLTDNGILKLSEVTENAIQSYFTKGNEILRGYSTLSLINRFLSLCRDCMDPVAFNNVQMYLPCIKKKYKPYPALEEDEAKKIQDVLLSESSCLSELAKAIGTLAFFTGLRTCDIVNLKIDDINWDKKTISIIQRKTKVPITLALRPVFANHICRYITQERPNCDDRHIFIRPKTKMVMNSADAYRQCVNIMFAAGVRQVAAHRGLHLFRHHLATKMINNGSNLAVVSAALGHRDPRTTFDYLSSNHMQLKRCALPITKYIRDEDYQ